MSFFQTEDHAGVLVVTMNRAPRNAFTVEFLDEGTALFKKLAATPPEDGIVITGADNTFSVGVDKASIAQQDRDDRRRLNAAIDVFFAALYRLPCAVISAVNGHAIGAGALVCLASDWVVAGDMSLKVGLPGAKAGLPFPRVPQIILKHGLDPIWRRRLALSSILQSPHQAMLSGLVDEVVMPNALLPVAIDRALDMQVQPGFAIVKADLRRDAIAEIEAGFVAI